MIVLAQAHKTSSRARTLQPLLINEGATENEARPSGGVAEFGRAVKVLEVVRARATELEVDREALRRQLEAADKEKARLEGELVAMDSQFELARAEFGAAKRRADEALQVGGDVPVEHGAQDQCHAMRLAGAAGGEG